MSHLLAGGGRRVAGLLTVGALLSSVAAGCRDGEPAASPTASSNVVLHPSPAPSGLERGRDRAAPLMIAADGLAGWSLTLTDDIGGWDTLSPCGFTEAEQHWLDLGHLREWEAGRDTPGWTVVNQFTVPFYRDGRVVPATEVVAQIRQVNTCSTYFSREGTPRLTGEISLQALPGVQASYAFCERIDRAAGKVYLACTAFLARAEVVSTLRVRTSEGAGARKLITELVEPAAKALSSA